MCLFMPSEYTVGKVNIVGVGVVTKYVNSDVRVRYNGLCNVVITGYITLTCYVVINCIKLT
jgi:hypothetical protein